jgi:hypothetical protein
MLRRRLTLLLIGVAVVSGVAIAQRSLRGPRVSVDVRALQGPVVRSASGTTTVARSPRDDRHQGAPATANVEVTPDLAPPPIFDGNAFIGRLKTEGTLTDASRKQLESALSVIAAAQLNIDRFPDPAVRARLQDNLIHQLTVRLRLVLGDEQSKPIAELLTQQRPHVVFEKEN